MSKRLIWIVTVFMGLAMASLILVQAYWIKNAIIVKDKQFDQLITRSMIDITHEIERVEIARISARISWTLIVRYRIHCPCSCRNRRNVPGKTGDNQGIINQVKSSDKETEIEGNRRK